MNNIATYILTFILGFFLGYTACNFREDTKMSESFLKQIIAIVVVGIWAYRLYMATSNPLIALSVRENLIMGIVVGAFFNPSKNVTEIIKNKLIGSNTNVKK